MKLSIHLQIRGRLAIMEMTTFGFCISKPYSHIFKESECVMVETCLLIIFQLRLIQLRTIIMLYNEFNVFR